MAKDKNQDNRRLSKDDVVAARDAVEEAPETDEAAPKTAQQQNASVGFAGSGASEEDLRNQLLRVRADFENFRRRAEEERIRLLSVARTDVILQLLPVIDNFERAFKDVSKDVEQTSWYGGIAAIKAQFDKVIADLGVERLQTVGRKFDPNLHEAVTHQPSDTHGKNIVSEEYEGGYRLGDHVIRHARVAVSSGKDTS